MCRARRPAGAPTRGSTALVPEGCGPIGAAGLVTDKGRRTRRKQQACARGVADRAAGHPIDPGGGSETISRDGTRALRYRSLSHRYAMVVRHGHAWPFGDIWHSDRLRLLVQPRWRPDADTYETATTVEIVVDLAGIEDDGFEVQLFEDMVVVEGRRQLPSCQAGAVYHAASIRQGPFQLELPLPAPVDPERVEARYDRGLLHITLPKRAEAG